MSLLTVLRSPSCENTSVSTESEVEEEDEDEEDGSSRSRTSSFEGFFASKSAAFSIPDGDFARKASKHGGEMQMHLQSMVNLLRDDDVLRLVVKLETKYQLPGKVRYLAVVSSFSLDDIEESVVLGIDWVNDSVSVGLVLPLWRDTAIQLDGDGGFELSTNYRVHILKPVSVQTMWTAFQWINKCSDNARKHNQYPAGTSHAWVKQYETLISSDQVCIKEWHETEDTLNKEDHSIGTSKEDELLMKLIRHKLREVMLKVDLEEVTSRQVRELLEEETQMELKQYKQFIDTEMLKIFGQMDSASQIYDHVYLGSEWNASNLEELKENGVGYVLNITREIDNFFAGTFTYYNIRLWDVEEANLLPYWDETFKFINQARENGSKVLVHCKMGISRSSSTVIAYGMKEYGTSLNDTMKHVKSRRQCIQPNQGFWKQLVTYEGILNSSRHRYNELFNNRRRTSSDKTDAIKGAKRRRNNRGRQKYSTMTTPTRRDPDVILEDAKSNTIERNVFHDDVGRYSEGGSELADDEDEDPPLTMRRFLKDSSAEQALQTWEDEAVGSANSTPVRSRSSSLDADDREVGVEEEDGAKNMSEKGEKRPLHRAHSTPSLSKVSKQRKAHKKTSDLSELRCHSLRELLTGRVAALKEDLKANTLGRTSETKFTRDLTTESNEVTTQNKESTDDIEQPISRVVAEQEESESKESKEPESEAVKDAENLQLEAEPEDVGSSEDQPQMEDAHGLRAVKTGTVKRQSKNFEEGKVNLPWEWEEMRSELDLEIEEPVSPEPLSPEPQETSAEESHTSGEEPLPGVVKKHTHALEKKYLETRERDSKTSGSDSDGDHIIAESAAMESAAPKKLIISEESFTVESVGKTPEAEQGLLGVLDTNIVKRRINEDMKKETLQRQLIANQKVQEVEEQSECKNEKAEEGKDTPEKVEGASTEDSEEPILGIVKRHTQDFEGMHCLKAEQGPRSPGSDAESELGAKGQQLCPSPQKEEHESCSSYPYKRVVIIKQEQQGGKVCDSPSTESNTEGTFDVDLMLQRVDEDMKKKMRDSGDEKFTTLSCAVDGPNTEIPGDAEDLTDNDDNETPRPGIVKLNTELLLGKRQPVSEQDDLKKTSMTVQDEGSDAMDGALVVPTKESFEPPSNKPEEPFIHIDSSSVTDQEREKVEDTDRQVGMVKRQTLIIEGKYLEDPDDRGDSPKRPEKSKDSVDRKSTPSPESMDLITVYGPGTGCTFEGFRVEVIPLGGKIAEPAELQSPPGTVKRQTLLFEGKGAVQQNQISSSESKPEPLLSGATRGVQAECYPQENQEDREEIEERDKSDGKAEDGGLKLEDDSIDTSSVVSVRLHLKLLEEIIRSSSNRQQYKHRTTTALAALEEKRSQIDIERNKKDSKLEKELRERQEEGRVRKEVTTEYKDDVFVPELSSDEESDDKSQHDNLLDSMSDSAVSLAIENAQKDIDSASEEPPASSSGNVKRRTLLIEEQLREKSTAVRRHESMPKSIRPIERPVLRKRSLSDITAHSSSVDKPMQPLDLSAELPSTSSLQSPPKDKNGKLKSDTVSEDKSSPKADEEPEKNIVDLPEKDNEDNSNLIELIELDNNDYQSPTVKETIQLLDGYNNKDMDHVS